MYKTGFDRNQLVLFPTALDDMIEKDSIVRVIDAFVDSVNFNEFKFKYSQPSVKGNRPFDPKDLTKLYLFGYNKKVRSSRSLNYFAKTNIECIWLLKGLKPDHRTISDFRKDNADKLKLIFYEFNLSLKELNSLSNTQSQDGVKVIAVNSKERNYTLNKVDDRIQRIKTHIDDYLNMVDFYDNIEDSFANLSDTDKARKLIENIDEFVNNDPSFNKEEYVAELKKYINKFDEYQNIQNTIIAKGDTQISLTDKESRLMKNNGKFNVCYNNQVIADENHFVTDFSVTDEPADLGSITDISKNVKKIYGFETLTNITDKGYNKREDMVNALENGIFPEVTPGKKQDDTYSLETVYEENEITDEMINSLESEDIKKCLRAGVIPNIYKDKISNVKIKEKNIVENGDIEIDDNVSEQELRDQAINNNCFTRHIKSDKVFCPMGEILRKKSVSKSGVRYCNKLACKNCKNPCCNSKYKTVDFKKGQSLVIPKNNTTLKITKQKPVKKKIKVVCFEYKIDRDLIQKRMSLSELPHAMLKRWRDASYVLLKGKKKVTGECAVYYCSENILHAKNLIGVERLIEYFKNKKENLLKIA